MPEARLQVILEAVDKTSEVIKDIGHSIDQASNKFESFGEVAKKQGEALSSVGKDLSLRVTAPIVGLGAAIGKLAIDAGRTADVRTAFERMSAGVIESTGGFLSAIKSATAGTVSNFEILKTANRALALVGRENFQNFQDDFGEMARLTRVAAKAMGIDTAEALETLVEGLGRGREMMLAKLGVTLDLERAYARYAESIGLAVADLTEQQKKTVFLNETMHTLRTLYGDVIISAGGADDAMTALTASFKDLRDEIGAAVAPIVIDLLSKFRSLFQEYGPRLLEIVKSIISAFENLSPTQQKIILAMTGLAVAIGPVLFIIGQMITTIGILAPIFGALLGPIGLAVLAVGALIAIGIVLWKNWETISLFFFQVWEGIKNKVLLTIDIIMGTLQAFWEGTQLVFIAIGDFLLGVIVFWAELLEPIFMPLAEASLVIEALITEVFTRIKDFFLLTWNTIKEFLILIWDTLKLKTEEATVFLEGLITPWLGRLQTLFSTIWNAIKDSVVGPLEAIKNAISGAVSFIVSMVDRAISAINQLRAMGASVRGGGIPFVPGLQAGGIVTRPMVARLGEAGPEAVIPLRRGGFGAINILITGNTISSELDLERVAERVGDSIIQALKYRTRL